MREDCDTCNPSSGTASQPPPAAAPAGAGLAPSGDAAQTTDPSSSAISQGQQEDPMDPKTFVCPLDVTSPGRIPTPSVVIEYCDRCRWQHRATWVQTELFLTFAPPKAAATGEMPAPTKASGGASLRSVMLIPLVEEHTGGRFRVWLLHGAASQLRTDLVWDRKVEGGFPELKELKQRIRDKIAPQQSLGHSDKGGKHGQVT